MHRVTQIMFACMSLMVAAPSVARGEDPKAKNDAPRQPRPWSKKPPKEWPQLVLTNEAAFEGHTPLKGASAFLIRMADGEILVATAQRLIGDDGGVKPTVRLALFDYVLTDWKVFPRTKPNAVIAAKGLGITSKNARTHDWLLIKLVHPKKKRAATPLRPRIEPAKVSETAYLVGVSDTDEKSAQNVYQGKIVEREGIRFTLQFDPPVNLDGFIGAPIIDQNGYLLGMMKGFLPSERKDGKENQCWGHDSSMAIDLWKQRSDKAAIDAKGPIRLALTRDWVEESSHDPNNIKTARLPPIGALVKLIARSKANAPKGFDLMAWGKHVQEAAPKDDLEEHHASELTFVKLHGRDTVQFEISGKMQGQPMRTRMILFEYKNNFCTLFCSAPEEAWSRAEPAFEDVFAAIE